MATFANVSDIVATTIQSRSGSLADSCTNNNALLYKLKERGNQKLFSGGNVILQEVMYNDTTTDRRKSSYGSTVAVSSASLNDEATPTQRKMSADAIACKAPSVCCCSVQ